MIQEYFRNFNIFSEKEINNLAQIFVPKRMNKFDFFINEGEYCSDIAFILNGIFRSYYTSENGNEHTFCFRFPTEILAPYSAFITGEPSIETIQAVTDVDLFVVKKKELDKLMINNSNWIFFLKLNAENEYLELEKRFFQLQKNNAKQRYNYLLENQPAYIQKIPLHYLASYLGITQRHLSRIRKEILL